MSDFKETNPYGYNGRLTADVLETIARCWPIVGGGMAEGTAWNLGQETFKKTIVTRLEMPVEKMTTANDPLFKKSPFAQLTPEVLRRVIEARNQERAAHIKDRGVMEKAGYMRDGKILADALWRDLLTAKLADGSEELGCYQLPGDQQSSFEQARHCYQFDRDGLYIAGSMPSPAEQRAVWEKQLSRPTKPAAVPS